MPFIKLLDKTIVKMLIVSSLLFGMGYFTVWWGNGQWDAGYSSAKSEMLEMRQQEIDAALKIEKARNADLAKSLKQAQIKLDEQRLKTTKLIEKLQSAPVAETIKEIEHVKSDCNVNSDFVRVFNKLLSAP